VEKDSSTGALFERPASTQLVGKRATVPPSLLETKSVTGYEIPLPNIFLAVYYLMSNMSGPSSNTMFNYFTKLPSKACIVEEANPRKVAPAYNKQHVENFQKDLLDKHLYECDLPSKNYLIILKSGHYEPFRLRQKPRGPLRSKLLQYCEDVRPPYFGTWQKKSERITGRRPFCKDESIFDYEVDSEAEWDIGGPGESLKGDDSEDEEELDDYEIDMKTFVPHGYVSDDEIEVNSDQEDNGLTSANQSMDKVVDCDQDISNVSVKIIGEKRVKLTPIGENNNGNRKTISTVTPAQEVNSKATIPQPTRQQKLDIKPVILGVYYENHRPSIISESKIHFMRAFQGFSCS